MSFTRYPDIDYDWRPASYWEPQDPLQAILSNVKGANRRELILDYARAGRFEEIEDVLLQDELTDDQRRSLGRIHPTFMGGEYLPRNRRGEVAIARITLDSTTRDVIEVRAAPSGDRNRYRIVDEYDSAFTVRPRTSRRPLTLAQVIELIDHGSSDKGYSNSLAICYLEGNFEALGSDGLDSLEGFVSISSDIYPELSTHYDCVLEDWFSAKQMEAKRASGDDEDEPE